MKLMYSVYARAEQVPSHRSFSYDLSVPLGYNTCMYLNNAFST